MSTAPLHATVAGLGSCLPELSLDNDQVIALGGLDSSDDWIRQRTGIHRRRRVAPGTSSGDLAVAASRGAIESAGIRPDLLILATTTPDRPCPATAPSVAHRLGLARIPAFDLSAVCSGFLYGLAVAAGLVRAGVCHAPLVVGTDTYSTIVDPTDRDTAAIFGDGAGAVVLTAGDPEAPGAIRCVDLGSDGGGADLITVPGGGSARPGLPDPGARYFRMQGRTVYARAVHHMTESCRRVLAEVAWQPDRLGAFIGHQANQRILDSVARRLALDPKVCFGNIRDLGNTAAASIPLVLADDGPQRAVPPGSPTLLTAFGGGLTWASVALTWPAALPVRTVL